MPSPIKNIHAREVFSNKGSPTIEVDVTLEDGSSGRLAAPGGTSRGRFEPVDLRDGDPSYFDGMGINRAVESVNTEVADCLRGEDSADQENIDRLLTELDGTSDKSRLGGNTIVATSLANAKAAAASKRIELFEHLGGGNEIPLAFVYLMFGGPAYIGLKGTCDFQEYALIPLEAKSFKEGWLSSLGIYRRICDALLERGTLGLPGSPNLPDFIGIPTARFDSNEEALKTITHSIETEGFEPGKDFGIYLDIAASQFHEDGTYHLEADDRTLTREEMMDWLEALCSTYPIVSMEDCLFEDDWEGWQQITARIGDRVQLVGDDLFVTNPERLKKGIGMGAANAIVIKPNQIGTLTETIHTVSLARDAGYGTVISPRSEEIWDPYVVHLCVGQNLCQGKLVGGYSGGEKDLNEILRIEDHLGDGAIYRGKEILSRFLG
jgi:enolase